jgi:hypothetical protein
VEKMQVEASRTSVWCLFKNICIEKEQGIVINLNFKSIWVEVAGRGALIETKQER